MAIRIAATTILARRVPQLTGLYIVVSWGFVQFVDWAVDQYSLSPALTNLVITIMLLLLPTVLLLAWRHGAPGEDSWTKTDAGAIGLNLIATGAILSVAFNGQELGAATTVKLVEDMEGNTLERVVPKAAFRRNVLLYNFDNESDDPDLDWLETGVVTGIAIDLAQDLFITFVLSDDYFLSDDGTVRDRLVQAGFDPTDKIPLSLKREAAERRSLAYFMEGAIRTDGDTLVIETSLYDTRTARQVATRTYFGTDPLKLADRISLNLRRDLGIPDWQIDNSVDLPAAELLTTSPEAFRAFVEYSALPLTSPVASSAMVEEAMALDTTFAMAYFVASFAALGSGEQADADSLMGEANRYAYRLPERVRLSFQVLDQWLYKQDPETAGRVARYWTEIYPEDADARRWLAGMSEVTGDMATALSQYRALLAIDSADVGTMRNMADLFRTMEEYDSAFVYYEQVGDRRPNDVRTRLDMAGTLSSLGRYLEARDELGQARIAAPDDPSVVAHLAALDLREGLFDDAIERVEQVTSLERTPQERERRIQLEGALYYQRGQFSRLKNDYRRLLVVLAENRIPLYAIGEVAASEYLIYAVEGGHHAYALNQIDSLRSSVEEPWSMIPESTAMRIYLDLGDVESARASLVGYRSLLEGLTSGREIRAEINWAEGRIAELEDENCRRALESYKEAQKLDPQNPLYHVARLTCLTMLQSWNGAEQEVAWLLERYPGRGTYLLAIARFYTARGQAADAIEQLETALGFWSEADDTYIPAQEARALLVELRGT